ncbi:hypothetical protein C8R47DRAFT_112255 [Mycena vitilis]|nr:hypothetical protein C8R47DRAFT_112255 [Mycena vitilis]
MMNPAASPSQAQTLYDHGDTPMRATLSVYIYSPFPSTLGFFPDASDAGVRYPSFVSGDAHDHAVYPAPGHSDVPLSTNAVLEDPMSENVNSSGSIRNQYSQPASSDTSFTRTINLLDDTVTEGEIYRSQLRHLGRGLPLFVPEPPQYLPAEYRRNGVEIGDVGQITAEGIFEFLFNVYLPADHPINNGQVPEHFAPLERFPARDVVDLDYEPGCVVSTSSIKRVDECWAPGSEFAFRCSAPQGAVLALPHGSHLKKLENIGPVRDYVAAHAERWFKYVRGRRPRLVNGSLYVVTGREKAQSWGMASFHSARAEFPLTFTPIASPHPPASYTWSGGNPFTTKSYHPPCGSSNQTMFIHGFSLSLGTRAWGLLTTVNIEAISDSRFENAGRNSMAPTPDSLFSWAAGLLREIVGDVHI